MGNNCVASSQKAVSSSTHERFATTAAAPRDLSKSPQDEAPGLTTQTTTGGHASSLPGRTSTLSNGPGNHHSAPTSTLDRGAEPSTASAAAANHSAAPAEQSRLAPPGPTAAGGATELEEEETAEVQAAATAPAAALALVAPKTGSGPGDGAAISPQTTAQLSLGVPGMGGAATAASTPVPSTMVGCCGLYSSGDRPRGRWRARLRRANPARATRAAAPHVAVGGVAPPNDRFVTKVNIRSVYRLGPILGTGSFGQVRCCEHKKTLEQFACKIMVKQAGRGSNAGVDHTAMFRNEVNILKIVSGHRNVARLVDVYEDRQQLYAVMERYDGGELFAKILQQRRLREPDAAAICVQLLRAVEYIHSHGIVHRDIKAENFLFAKPTNLLSYYSPLALRSAVGCRNRTAATSAAAGKHLSAAGKIPPNSKIASAGGKIVAAGGRLNSATKLGPGGRLNSTGIVTVAGPIGRRHLNSSGAALLASGAGLPATISPNAPCPDLAGDDGRLVLIDFGMSVKLDDPNAYLRQLCGSPHYVAPELIRRRYRHEVDLWATGIIVFLMLYGRYPFEGADQKLIAHSILKAEPDYSWTPARPSPEAIDFVKGLLTKDPTTRFTVKQCLGHPWIIYGGACPLNTLEPSPSSHGRRKGSLRPRQRAAPRHPPAHPRVVSTSGSAGRLLQLQRDLSDMRLDMSPAAESAAADAVDEEDVELPDEDEPEGGDPNDEEEEDDENVLARGAAGDGGESEDEGGCLLEGDEEDDEEEEEDARLSERSSSRKASHALHPKSYCGHNQGGDDGYVSSDGSSVVILKPQRVVAGARSSPLPAGATAVALSPGNMALNRQRGAAQPAAATAATKRVVIAQLRKRAALRGAAAPKPP